MPEFLKAIVFGIIEGITEWLPISSTGHMILADEFIKFSSSAEFKEMFLVVIQLGAILAVVVLYFNKLNPFSKKRQKKRTPRRSCSGARYSRHACPPQSSECSLTIFWMSSFSTPLRWHLCLYCTASSFLLWRTETGPGPREFPAFLSFPLPTPSLSERFRCFPDSRNLPVRGNHPWRNTHRDIAERRRGIYVFSGNTDYVWCKPA